MKFFRPILVATGLTVAMPLFAGGILTNTNQSASFIRMPSRNASLNIDAVYYNPAGLAFLDKGWHFSLNNQGAFQKRIVTNSLSSLNNNTYEGIANSYIIPSLHAAYLKGDFAFSLGLGVYAGGGSAEFDKGLPSFEAPISALPAMLTANKIPTSNYSVDMDFKGSSATLGGQLGASYKLNNMFSVALGARVVSTTNTYEGHLKNIQANIGMDKMVNVSNFFTTQATRANGAANSLQPAITAGAGGYTLNQMVASGQMSQQEADMLLVGLGANYNPAMTVAQVQGAYNMLNASATAIAQQTTDKYVDVKQTGMGFTPIIGANFCYESLVIAAKYEFETSMNLTNDTKRDGTGMFPDGTENSADIPAMLALGSSYNVIPTLKVSLGYNRYLDTDAAMENDKQQYIDHDGNEYLLGVEWNCHKRFLVSAGYQYSDLGVTPAYQSDMAHSFDSYSVGMGGAVKINEKCRLNLGYFFTKYTQNSKETTYNKGTQTETYDRKNNVFAIGVDYRF